MTSTRGCSIDASAAPRSADGRLRTSMSVLLLPIAAYLCLGLALYAQTDDSQETKDANKSWTATTDFKRSDVNPPRIIESHTQNGNRTLDKRTVQFGGFDGHFQTFEEIETETLQVDASTVRTTTRTFGRDGEGRKTLVQVAEEEKQRLPGGDSNMVRAVFTSDLNGKLQPVRPESVETKRIDTDTEQTNSTVMLPSINGGFAPAIQTHEVRKRGPNNTLESEVSTLRRDGAGNWQVSELRQATIRDDGKNRSTEERVSRRDAEGKIGEVSRLVSMESENDSREKYRVEETYSIDVPGTTRDGGLHLVERATATQRITATGEQIAEKKVEQPNPGAPDAGLRLSIVVDDTVRRGPSGVQATRTVRTRDPNGSFGVVEVDMTNSDKVLTIQVQETPSQESK
jgi:hypothetical protein